MVQMCLFGGHRLSLSRRSQDSYLTLVWLIICFGVTHNWTTTKPRIRNHDRHLPFNPTYPPPHTLSHTTADICTHIWLSLHTQSSFINTHRHFSLTLTIHWEYLDLTSAVTVGTHTYTQWKYSTDWWVMGQTKFVFLYTFCGLW